ncbi:MAG: hypothetical protein KIT42_16485, partial [Rhodocyclaceae bacterium]|nr:hypothetical protein [Rhodocyclaceae bacterium]
SLDKERNDAAGAIGRNPKGTGFSGRRARRGGEDSGYSTASRRNAAMRPESPVRTNRMIENTP